MKKPPKRGGYVEHARRILVIFEEEIPKRAWKKVVLLINEYVDYSLERGRLYRKGRRKS